MAAPKKLVELVKKNNAAGAAKFLRERKRPLSHRVVLGLFSEASEEVIQQLIEVMLEQPHTFRILPTALQVAPDALPSLLAAGAPVSPLAISDVSKPEHLVLFVEYGWDPATLQQTDDRGWGVWANKTYDFHATALQAGATLGGHDLAILLSKRFTSSRRLELEREHFEMLLSHVPTNQISQSFEAVGEAKTLSDIAVLYLPAWGLEILMDRGASAPTAVMTPESPDLEAKEALLKERGLAVSAMDSRGFVAAHNYTPQDGARLLVTQGGLLGLHLGMSEAEAGALGFVEGQNDFASVHFKDGVVSRVSYSTYDASASAASDAISEALTVHYGEADVDTPTRTVWETPAGRITRTSQYQSMIGQTEFELILEPGEIVAGVMPTDLEAFGRELLDYLQDVGPDVFGTQVKSVAVQAVDAGLLITGQFGDGDEVLFEWSGRPLSLDGGLTDDFSTALVSAFSAADTSN